MSSILSANEISEIYNSCRSDPKSWAAAQWLRSKGVSTSAICEPNPVFAARVATTGDYFDIVTADEDGDAAFLFLVTDLSGCPVDIVAWQPKPKRLFTWLKIAVFLGEGELYAPRLTTEGALCVFRSPLSWLLADRRGIVILNAEAAASRLAGLGPLIAEDTEHGQTLRKMLTIPAPRILVPTSEMIAA